MLACTGPPALVASTLPFTVLARTSLVTPSTLTPPFTAHTPTFTPFGHADLELHGDVVRRAAASPRECDV